MPELFAPNDAKQQLLVRMLAELRPRLHRYCARMTGSAVDGEDVVQEVLLKVLESPPDIENFSMLERWLIRVGHNTAVDFLRRRTRHDAIHATEDLSMIIDPSASVDASDTALASLRTFIRLPPLQRSTVIFKDVLGYSLEEVAEFTASSIAAAAKLKKTRMGQHQLWRGGIGTDASEELKNYEYGDPFLLEMKETLFNSIVREGPRGW